MSRLYDNDRAYPPADRPVGTWSGWDPPDEWDEDERAEREHEERLANSYAGWMRWLDSKPDARERLEALRKSGRKCWHLKGPDNCMWCDDIEGETR